MDEQRKKITPRQRAFIDEFLKDRNATQAAIRAGYSARTAKQQGSRLLTNVDVSTEINKALARISEKVEMRAAHVLAEIGKIAFVNISQAFAKDGSLLHPQDMPENVKIAISVFESRGIFAGRGVERKKIGETKRIRIHNKIEALRMLAQHFRLLTDGPEISTPESSPAPLTPQDVEKLEKRLLELEELRRTAGDD